MNERKSVVTTCAYLDIETTGLSPYNDDLTVIGICLDNGKNRVIEQLVGDEISRSSLGKIIKPANNIYTYNGKRFDLPFIKAKLGVDLTKHCNHIDLMYDCWQRKLFGGFKAVEKHLGIKRKLNDIDGLEAVELWYKYKHNGDNKALVTLLEYNKEDILNLVVLRQKLSEK